MAPSTRFDLIVVGSGIAGLYAALLASQSARVLLVTKGATEEGNTRYAQGGIAAALAPGDSSLLHASDTIAAGDGLCDARNVSVLTSEGTESIQHLLQIGVPFDHQGADLAWTREAAHSLPRILHAGGDATGASIESVLAAAVGDTDVRVLEHATLVDLVSDGEKVTGIKMQGSDGLLRRIEAERVLLATGGAGQLFRRTTNPTVATGDGLAAAFRAGAELMDMEFYQFHPTALALDGAPSFLISEAARGEGGILRNRSGAAFMATYHPDCELAPRDVVARAIHREMIRTDSPNVYLDVTHLESNLVERRFPTILRFCRRFGINPIREPIPVSPAAHYFMGGIRTDSWGRTNLTGLSACGEVACTGVHGANRLASNSLLEGLVFARRVVADLQGRVSRSHLTKMSTSGPGPEIEDGAWPADFRRSLAETMWRDASLVRTASSLRAARNRIAAAATANGISATDLETSNLAVVGQILIHSALLRQESRGAHFRSDFSRREAGWRRHIIVSRHGVTLTPITAQPALAAAG